MREILGLEPFLDVRSEGVIEFLFLSKGELKVGTLAKLIQQELA